MNQKLEIGIFQFDIVWHNINSNRDKVERVIQDLPEIPDVLILPEMYSTGFTMTPDLLDSTLIENQVEWQSQLSVKYNLAIMGSVVMLENQYYKNRMLFTSNQGSVQIYDKRHLFLHEKESGLYKAGNKRKCFMLNEMKVMPQICYDLRFPVWSRNDLNYEILLYVANWPSVRQQVWETLLRARAIENQCYVVGVNRVGEDGNGIRYSGGSIIFNPKGEVGLQLKDNEEYRSLTLYRKTVHDFKDKFPVYKDIDRFTINY